MTLYKTPFIQMTTTTKKTYNSFKKSMSINDAVTKLPSISSMNVRWLEIILALSLLSLKMHSFGLCLFKAFNVEAVDICMWS
jgi:hypothetical protein